MIDIRVLGTLELRRPDGSAPVVGPTQPKRVALLIYLALAEPPGPQSRDSLMALLWPEADAESARHSLRNALYGLRQALGEALFVARGEGYVGLEPGAVRCDALEVRGLLATHRWEEAVAAWGGDLVPGFHVSGAPEFERWLDDQRAGLRRAVMDAAWRQVDELERSGEPGLVSAARRAWTLDQANEAGARRLMRFVDASVGCAAALRAYDDLAEYLRRESEAGPSPATRALADELRARIEGRAPPVRVAHAPQAPTLSQTAPAAQQVESAVAPSGFSHRGRRSVAVAGIAGALLMTALVSVFALLPAGSARLPRTPELMDSAGREAVLRLPAKYRRDTAAYASYLRGLSLRLKGSLTASRDTFEALVDREPLYAPGLSGLAHAYAMSTVYAWVPSEEGWPKAEAAAHRAIALDSTSASAYLALAASEMFWRWNLPRAAQLIERGVALEPSDPEAHAIRGVWFRWQGRMDSAVAEARKSHELDPLNPQWTERLASELYGAKNYSEAEAVWSQVMRDYPESARSYQGLSDVYLAMGHMRDALVMLRTSKEVAGDSAGAARMPSAPSEMEAARWFADLSRERLRDLQSRLRAGDRGDPFDFVFAYAALRDTGGTLRWLDTMLVRHDPGLSGVLVSPKFDFMRSDPRYQAWEAALPWRRRQAAPR